LGFVLSILYLVTNYLTPETLFGPLAAYRVELILAVLIVLVSMPVVIRSYILKTTQSLALIGLAFAVFMSVLFGQRWLGGGVQAFLTFIPNAFAFFIVCLHGNSKKKLQVVVLMLLGVCLFVIARGSFDLRYGAPQNSQRATNLGAVEENAAVDQWNNDHPYLFEMENDAGEKFFRIRGLGEVNDPNDFAQLTVCVIPLMFIFWRSGKILQNAVLVILPVCVLLVGVFLTHSRGALIALIAMVIVAVRRRIGTVPAFLIAAAIFVAAMSLQFTGGRDISASAGEDRTALWSEGFEVFRSHPVFGVGLSGLSDYTDEHLTAHNSVIVCAAELGLFGFYFWCIFLLSTIRDVLTIDSHSKVSAGHPIVLEESPLPQPALTVELIDKAEINSLGRLLLLSLTGFLTAGMFLSRAFVPTLFLLGGMVEVVFAMALERGMVAPRLALVRVLGYACGLMIVLLVAMYLIIRVLNLMN
jgi:O-antigen ligase